MRYFFMISATFSVISFIVLLMQEYGTLEFMVTAIAFICFLLVAVFSGYFIKKGKE